MHGYRGCCLLYWCSLYVCLCTCAILIWVNVHFFTFFFILKEKNEIIPSSIVFSHFFINFLKLFELTFPFFYSPSSFCYYPFPIAPLPLSSLSQHLPLILYLLSHRLPLLLAFLNILVLSNLALTPSPPSAPPPVSFYKYIQSDVN